MALSSVLNGGKTLKGLSEIRQFLLKSKTPIYYFCENSAVLVDVHHFYPALCHVNYYDIWNGMNPSVTAVNNPIDEECRSFHHADCAYNLMQRQQTKDLIANNGGGGKALFFHIDERTHATAEKLGLDMILPPVELRNFVDSKVQTTLIGNRAGVPSVPNVLSNRPIDCYATLLLEAATGNLGTDLVVQLPYGCGGDTTFFIANQEDWDNFSERIMPEQRVKIMRRIRCQASAQEACVTKQGTIVGPLMTELVGFMELTPVRGAWCGNEVAAESFTEQQRQKARYYTEKFGQELLKEGYRGYFEIDYLWDLDTGDLYLGELNPRISGAAPMTNAGLLAKSDLPMIMFHILEWLDVPFELDISALNDRWADPANEEDWSQFLIMKTDHSTQPILHRPQSGIYCLTPQGDAKFLRATVDRSSVSFHETAKEFFFTCELPHKNAEYWDFIGTVTARGRMLTPANKLTERAKKINSAMRAVFAYGPDLVANQTDKDIEQSDIDNM